MDFQDVLVKVQSDAHLQYDDTSMTETLRLYGTHELYAHGTARPEERRAAHPATRAQVRVASDTGTNDSVEHEAAEIPDDNLNGETSADRKEDNLLKSEKQSRVDGCDTLEKRAECMMSRSTLSRSDPEAQYTSHC